MKHFARRVACTIFLLLCGAGFSQAYALQVKDDRGAVVTFAQTPQRIVSLLPSLTESVCAMEQCQRLVGRDRYSNYPASVQPLPVLGGGLDPNLEAIVALRPDVVLMAVSGRAGERLEALGIKVVALEPKSHADVRRVLYTLGVLLDVPEDVGAARLWRTIDSGVSAAAQSLPPQAKNSRVYFEVSRGPYAASESSFIGETLKRLGARNVVPAALGPFPKLNPEFVVRADPDLIMISSRGMQAMLSYPGWAGISAVRKAHICVFTPAESDVLGRPGPRMAEAARIMANCIGKHAVGRPQ